eukprot:augustus_masked-scaffold_21-processed-gene-5.20-mRNA-1 protein AED:0.08 eAED:0.37 QI:0/-1/0/1/-1/1/1/0/1180
MSRANTQKHPRKAQLPEAFRQRLGSHLGKKPSGKNKSIKAFHAPFAGSTHSRTPPAMALSFTQSNRRPQFRRNASTDGPTHGTLHSGVETKNSGRYVSHSLKQLQMEKKSSYSKKKNFSFTVASSKRAWVTSQVLNRIKRNENNNKTSSAVSRYETQAKTIKMLKRGGVYVKTCMGGIQFGLPPETIKDVLNAGLDFPKYYVIPKEKFNLRLGISCAELEFPMFFSYYVKSTVVTFICEKEEEKQLDVIIRESTIGPEPEYLTSNQEYLLEKTKAKAPNHQKEIEHYRTQNKLNEYNFFDKNGFVYLGEGKEQVILFDNVADFRYEIFDYSMFLDAVKPTESMLQKGRKKMHLFGRKTTMKKPAQPDFVLNMKNERVKISDDSNEKIPMINHPLECFRYLRSHSPEQLDPLEYYHIISYDEAEYVHDAEEDLVDGPAFEPEKSRTTQVDIEEILSNGPTRSSPYGEDETRPAMTRAVRAPMSIKHQFQREKDFEVPEFGVTILGNSHGFDPKGSTTGFVLWVDGEGMMVDPPPHSSALLERYGIRPKLITGIILTHCHADHDAGTFQKLIRDDKVELFTSATIYHSFVRKYSALSGLADSFIQSLFNFKPVYLEEPHHWKGAKFRFFYSLHSIPCIGFDVEYQNKKIVYSADTYYNKAGITQLKEKGVLSEGRAQALIDFPWDSDLVLHECGVAPLHTPFESFLELDSHQRKNIQLVHIAGKEKAKAEKAGFKIAKAGIKHSNTLLPKNKANQFLRWLRVVGSMEIFEHFSIDKALDLVQMAQYKRYKENEVIQGYDGTNNINKDPKKFMIILSGTGYGFVHTTQATRVLTRGDYFGEHVFVSEQKMSTNDAEAKTQGPEDKYLRDKRSRDTKDIVENRATFAEFNGSAYMLEREGSDEDLPLDQTRDTPEYNRPLSETDDQSDEREPKNTGRQESDADEIRETGEYYDEVVPESLVAETDMEILELDFFAVKSLLIEDETLTQKMTQIVNARYSEKHAAVETSVWEAINANTILQRLRLEQKLELQVLLKRTLLGPGEIAHAHLNNEKYLWKAKRDVHFALVVIEGTLIIEISEENRRKQSVPNEQSFIATEEVEEESKQKTENFKFGAGCVAFDYIAYETKLNPTQINKTLQEEQHSFTLRAGTEGATIAVVSAEEFVRFMAKNPHLQLAFYQSMLVF